MSAINKIISIVVLFARSVPVALANTEISSTIMRAKDTVNILSPLCFNFYMFTLQKLLKWQKTLFFCAIWYIIKLWN